MNRSHYFNYIEEKLNRLSSRIHIRNKINLLDLNIHSESFFAMLMNYIFGYELTNINAIKQNVKGIDLVDEKHKIIVQVSSTCSKEKIENSLKKSILNNYHGFNFKFIAIAGDASKLKDKRYQNPYDVIFTPSIDIYDITSLLRIVLNMNINDQRKIYEFIKDELGNPTDIVKLDSNLTAIINIISKENLSIEIGEPELNPFEISRKLEFNELLNVEAIIDEYKIYYNKLNEKYREFDRQGINKSLSVLTSIKKQYVKKLDEDLKSPEIFYAIIDNLINQVLNSKNYVEMPIEELEMCVSILVVDAFIRCKIFKNPEGYRYVTTR